jgi:E3 ubiquitin-protein ligase HERC2
MLIFQSVSVDEISCILFRLQIDGHSAELREQVMAAMVVIGGIDTRPRLGGLVTHEDYGIGTVSKIMPSGKITVQFFDLNESRVCRLSELTAVSWCKNIQSFLSTPSLGVHPPLDVYIHTFIESWRIYCFNFFRLTVSRCIANVFWAHM